jgi:hypothetical protein
MRLRYIHHGDFRKNTVTLYNEVQKRAPGLKLGSEDCVLVVSGTGKILRFVYGFDDLEVIGGRTKLATGNMTRVLQSEEYRIDGAGTWNPLMLRNYAEALGIQLAGLKRFEESFQALQAQKLAARKKRAKRVKKG